MQRRNFIAGLAGAAAFPILSPLTTHAQQMNIITAPGATLKRARTKTLEIAYEESGPETGVPVVLMHGFPYDPRCFDEVVPRSRPSNGPFGAFDKSGGMAREPHRLDGVCLDPGDDIGVVDRRE